MTMRQATHFEQALLAADAPLLCASLDSMDMVDVSESASSPPPPMHTQTHTHPHTHPQTHPHALAIRRRGKADDVWETHKDTIKMLYIDQGRSLKEVVEIMKRDYGFEAS